MVLCFQVEAGHSGRPRWARSHLQRSSLGLDGKLPKAYARQRAVLCGNDSRAKDVPDRVHPGLLITLEVGVNNGDVVCATHLGCC